MPSLGRLRIRRVCVSPLLVARVTVVLLHTGSVAAQFGGRNTAGPGRGGPGPSGPGMGSPAARGPGMAGPGAGMPGAGGIPPAGAMPPQAATMPAGRGAAPNQPPFIPAWYAQHPDA